MFVLILLSCFVLWPESLLDTLDVFGDVRMAVRTSVLMRYVNLCVS